MFRTLRPFFIALVCTWIALAAAAFIYSRQHPQFHWIMRAALPAFAVEAIFYLGAGFEETRIWFSRIDSRRAQSGLLWIFALLPYLIFSFAAGTFESRAFYLLAALCAIFSFWYTVLPWRAAYDAGFLIIGAAPILLHVFERIYVAPDPHTGIFILGHLMWIHTGILALLVIRQWDPGPFSFWPNRGEWNTGALWFIFLLAPIIALALGLHDVRFAPQHGEWWRIAANGFGIFFGALWVIAFGEQLLFVGVIERALLNTGRSPAFAIAIAAILFGAVHLWFREFPNWRRALVVVLLGIACGLGYLRTGSVRAPMVTHALVVTTWRMFFR